MAKTKKERDRDYYLRHLKVIKSKAQHKRKTCPEYILYHKAKNRAKKRKLPFNIEIDDIIIPNTCPILHIKLERNSRYRGENTPSLDRIYPEKGYVKGNVQVISWRANRIKNDGTLQDFEKIVKYLRQI